MHRTTNLNWICCFLIITTLLNYATSQIQEDVSITPTPENTFNTLETEEPDPFDLTFIIPVKYIYPFGVTNIKIRLENVLFLKNCLRSLFDVLSNEKPSLKVQVLVLEIGHLATSSKIYERKLGIQSSIEPYTNTFLIESEDRKGEHFFLVSKPTVRQVGLRFQKRSTT
jgi:hypothetical protein